MSDFQAKMLQIQFQLGLRHRPCWGSLQRSSGPLAVKGPTSKESGGERREWREGRDLLYFFLRIYADIHSMHDWD